MDAECLRHPVGVVLGTLTILLLLALAILPYAAAPQELPQVGPIQPVMTSTAGPNITYDARAQVLSMGEFDELWLSFSLVCNEIFQGEFPGGIWLSPGDEADMIHVTIRGTYSTEITPPPESTCDYVLNRVTYDPTVPEWRSTYIVNNIVFQTPSVGTIGTPATHPFAPGIQSLGLPLDITLGILGFIWMMLAFTITAIFRMDPETTTTALMVVTSFNLFMRFWPTFLLILLAFFLGFLLVRQFGGAGGEAE